MPLDSIADVVAVYSVNEQASTLPSFQVSVYLVPLNRQTDVSCVSE